LGQARSDGSQTFFAFRPDSHAVLQVEDPDWTTQLWDVETARPLWGPAEDRRTLRHESKSSSDEEGVAFSLSPDGRFRPERWGVAFSPDGRSVLTSIGQGAQFWDAATGHRIGPAMKHDNEAWIVAFSPDGRTALTWDGHQARPGV